MDAEPEELEPREVKVLADILALVLEDQPGSSAVALETLRRKARQSRVTGGALKNLFQSIAAHPPEKAVGRTASRPIPDTPEGMQASIERLRATNRTLERALAAANGEAARVQADLAHLQMRLVESQQHSRGFADRLRSGRRQAGLIGAAIAVCVLSVSGVVAERLFIHPSTPAGMAEPAPASPSSTKPPAEPGRPFEPTSAVPPLPKAAGGAGAPPASAENDPELQVALRRLSHTGEQQEPGGAADESVPASLAAAATLPTNAAGYLSPEVYGGVISHVRTCWRTYVSRLGDVRFQARLHVLADESGVVREARLAQEDLARLTDPSFQTYVDAAMHSVLDRDCAQLPVPAEKLGRKISFDFVFVP